MNFPLISEYVEAVKMAEDNFDQLSHLRTEFDEQLSTEVTQEDLAEAVVDEFGVKYSKDGKRLLIGLQGYVGSNIKYTIREGTNVICNRAFGGCSGMTSIIIPDSVGVIGEWAFYGNKGLTNIHIPNSVIKIGYGAFAKCTGLTSIHIPNSIAQIEPAAFSECINMNSITVSQDNPYFDSRENCNAIICTKTNTLIAGCKDTHIPNSVAKIGNRAFWGCRYLTNIYIPCGVTQIGKWSFAWCNGLITAHIFNSVTQIGHGAFFNCCHLSRVHIPDSVTQIGHGAFLWCNRLTSIYIPYKTKEKFAKLLPNHKSFLVEISEKGFIMENKSNWQEFKALLDKYQIEKLYHFTDKENIDSIIKHGGLYSWSDCENKGITIAKPGGSQRSRELDYNEGLQGFVRVCFTKEHPMMYKAMQEGRILNPIRLEIDPKVVYLKTTLFADRNATERGVNIGGKIEDFKKIHFDSIKADKHFDLVEEEHPYFQAEVLVDGFIPLDYITFPF